MEQFKSKLGYIASLFAAITCYGTIASIALLSFVGISVDVDWALLIKIITILLAFALLNMVYSWHLHKNVIPLLLSVIAIGVLIWVFYGPYSRLLEFIGFFLLMVASILDFRSKKKICMEQSKCNKP